MSVVSSVLSTRSTGWRINVRFSSLMDSIFAIGFGLGLRFVVDAVSHHDFKLTGTLVGLWEGVIMLHFLKKMPKSSDPYIAYGVRLFIDFLFTESIARMVLVLIWTALGMVLADITPAIWDDVGLKRIWRSFRRDLYTISRMIPTVAFFPPARTVRFSPSREPSIVIEATEVLSPSEITAEQTPITNIDPTSATTSREVPKRRVPGYFPVDFSDTETDAGSIRIDEYTLPERTSRRLSVYPQRRDSEDSSSDLSISQDELDEGNLSSLHSDATQSGEPQSALPDASEIPEMQLEEEPLLVDTQAAQTKPEDGELTPTQRQPIFMPPTPSDSAPRWRNNRDLEDPLPIRPPSEFLPQIPDFLDEPTTEDWEKIQPEDYDKPPTPPAKDNLTGFKIPKVPTIPPPVPPTAHQSRSPPAQEDGWDTLDSQFLSRPPAEENPIANPSDDATKRQSQPPSYEDVNYDDIYDDPPHTITNDVPTGHFFDDDTGVPPADAPADTGAGSLQPLAGLTMPSFGTWGLDAPTSQNPFEKAKEAEEAARLEEEVARLKAEEEEAEKARIAEEAAKAEEEAKKQAEEDVARQAEEDAKRQAEEQAKKEKKEAAAKEKERKANEKKKKEAEKAEIARKEQEDDIARKKRAYEAEENKKADEAEKKILAQIKKDAEEAQLRREEAAKKKAEEEEAKRAVEEEAKKVAEEEAKRVAAEKRRKDEEEQRLKEEAEKKAKEDEEKRLKEEQEAKEEADKKTKDEDEDEKRKLREDEDRKAQETEHQNVKEDEQKVEEEAKNDGTGQANLDQTQGDVAPAPEESSKELLTPTMSPRNLNENPEVLLDALEDPSVVSVLDTVDVQSNISDAPPIDAEIRVERMLLLRAQMVETESSIEALKSAGSDFAHLEKVLRKMERQAKRRYAAGTPYAELLNDFDEPDTVNLDILNPQKSRRKVAEKIEQLLDPTSRKLYFKINFGKKQNDGKRQKPAIIEFLADHNMLDYTKEGTQNKKISTVHISEENFGEWLAGYRALLTREKAEDFRPWG